MRLTRLIEMTLASPPCLSYYLQTPLRFGSKCGYCDANAAQIIATILRRPSSRRSLDVNATYRYILKLNGVRPEAIRGMINARLNILARDPGEKLTKKAK